MSPMLNIALCQNLSNESTALTGEMEFIFDLSNMEDTTEGRFMIMAAGEQTFHEIKNNQFIVKRLLDEPRVVDVFFYPTKIVNENKGKPLNEIMVENSDHIQFLGVPGRYNIVVNGTLADSKIVNESIHQKKYTELLRLKDSISAKAQEEVSEKITKELEEIGVETPLRGNMEKRVYDSILLVFEKRFHKSITEKYRETIFDFVKQNPNEPVSLLELFDNSSSVGGVGGIGQFDSDMLSYLYNNLTDRLKSLPMANSVYAEVYGNNLIGKQAPDFTLTDPSGKPVSLKDFKGNITLLEFWASWCAPCRASNPRLLKIYQRFYDKGFRVLGVSLDNKKKNWLKAIDDDGLIWTHVSDLKRVKNTAAKLYNVWDIPSNFLIDRNGKIIQHNLKGDELNEYLEKMLE